MDETAGVAQYAREHRVPADGLLQWIMIALPGGQASGQAFN